MIYSKILSIKFRPVPFVTIRFIVAVKLPNIMSGATTFENILSMSVLEWLVILVVHEIKGLNE